MRSKNFIIILFAGILSTFECVSQQEADTTFTAEIADPLFTETSPVVAIDTLHNNLHTRKTGFAPFAKLVSQDGFKVIDFNDYSQLDVIDILVIANPLHSNNIGNWTNPVYPAFSPEEVNKIVGWVKGGGSLLLIADHMPFAGAANILAQEFGFSYCNGFANLQGNKNKRDVFSIENSRLNMDKLSFKNSEINEIYTFTGSAFSYPEKAFSILNFKDNDVCLLPDRAWDFDNLTPSIKLHNKSQGAVMNFGEGRIAIFGEAAMFTAQTIKQNDKTFKVGFNSPFASDNVPFIRQILKWLSETDTDPVEEEILMTMRQMENIFNAGKFKDVADFYTEDGQMIGNSVHVKGIKDLKKYWEKFSGQLTWKLENESVVRLSEKHVLQNGYSNIYFIGSDGQKQNSRSFFSLLWEKHNDQWKIKLDHFSPRN